MKKIFFVLFLVSLIFSVSCSADDKSEAKIPAGGANTESYNGSKDPDDFRKAMRDFVISISTTAKKKNPNFVIVPQNGQEVAWDDDDSVEEKVPYSDYLAAIDGIGREDMFFGYDADNKATKNADADYLKDLCSVYKDAGKTVLATDYCWGKNTAVSYSKNEDAGFVGFAAPDRELNKIPENSEYFPRNVNKIDVKNLSDAKNFLYLINPEFDSAYEFVNALSKTNYDVLIIDLFFDEKVLSAEQVSTLKKKANGGSRLVICYMSIGEAEDYRWYWNSEWKKNPPSFVCEENPDWEGNFKVKYWDSEWQEIIFSGADSYLSKILSAGFDGVYLDIIDAYEYFE
ncbi:MAG: endo alpha-1,4 polygalactosaminidase [Treponema sp.]|nr:endo alpha-1,4 polygalactosaminidase [Candidatus Treponema equifaecale]